MNASVVHDFPLFDSYLHSKSLAPHYYDLIYTIRSVDNLHTLTIVNTIYLQTPDVLPILNWLTILQVNALYLT